MKIVFSIFLLFFLFSCNYLDPEDSESDTTESNFKSDFPELIFEPTSDTPHPKVSEILNLPFHRVLGEEAGGAVLNVQEGTWLSSYVMMPTVHFDGTTYRMWFVGGETTQDDSFPYQAVERIGLAISNDGVHWELANDGKPVLDLGELGEFDSKGVTHPYVMKVRDGYYMWYGGIDGTTSNGLRVERVGLATSFDGINWTRRNHDAPVLNNGETIDREQATGMHVLYDGEKLVMFYGAFSWSHNHTLGIATSLDGVTWVKGNSGLALPGLSGTQQLGPSIYFDGEEYLMLYEHPDAGYWRMYAARSNDGISWTPRDEDLPMLGPSPEGDFASNEAGRNHSVHPSQLIFNQNKVMIWYNAEDEIFPYHQRIGLMTTDF